MHWNSSSFREYSCQIFASVTLQYLSWSSTLYLSQVNNWCSLSYCVCHFLAIMMLTWCFGLFHDAKWIGSEVFVCNWFRNTCPHSIPPTTNTIKYVFTYYIVLQKLITRWPNDNRSDNHDWSLVLLAWYVDYLHGKWPMADRCVPHCPCSLKPKYCHPLSQWLNETLVVLHFIRHDAKSEERWLEAKNTAKKLHICIPISVFMEEQQKGCNDVVPTMKWIQSPLLTDKETAYIQTHVLC